MLLRAVSLLKLIINVSWDPIDHTEDNKENVFSNGQIPVVNDTPDEQYQTKISINDRIFVKENIFAAMHIAETQLQSSTIVSELENIFYNICQTDCGQKNQWPEC